MSRDFYRTDATARTSWRMAVLMGDNSATYKFALGSALLDLAATGLTEVPLHDLAVPYAMALAEHLEGGVPQAPEGSPTDNGRFLTVARGQAAESLSLGRPTELLLDEAVSNMPGMVMKKFHNLSGGQVPDRFFEVTGSPKERIVRLTPALLQVAASEQMAGLRVELTARWNIVETAFETGIGKSLVLEGMAVDPADDELRPRLTDVRRRRSVTGVAEAVIGFQHGRCLICEEPISPGEPMVVDHVFPFALMKRFAGVGGWNGPDLDTVWNLASAHAKCNGAKTARLPSAREVQLLAERNQAIANSPAPLKRTLQLTLKVHRVSDWHTFLRHVINQI